MHLCNFQRSLDLLLHFLKHSPSNSCLGCKTFCLESSSSLFFASFVWVLPLFILSMVLDINTSGEDCPGVYSFDEISAAELGFKKRSFFFRYSFSFFSFISFFMVPASNIPECLWFSFSSRVLMHSWFGCSIPSVVSFFLLLIITMAHSSMLKFHSYIMAVYS